MGLPEKLILILSKVPKKYNELVEILIVYKKKNDVLLAYKEVLVSMIPLKSLTQIFYHVLFYFFERCIIY
jgi:stage III sporulation protein SpoIIIAA